MSIAYPIFAFEKDGESMRLIESEERILYHLEAIDIENGEYVFWDATGVGVKIDVSVSAFSGKLKGVSSCSAEFPVRDALKFFAKKHGISGFSTELAPIEIWRSIKDQIQNQSEGAIRRGID